MRTTKLDTLETNKKLGDLHNLLPNTLVGILALRPVIDGIDRIWKTKLPSGEPIFTLQFIPDEVFSGPIENLDQLCSIIESLNQMEIVL